MINKIKKMYPGYLIIVKSFGKFIDVSTNNQVVLEKLKKPYVIIDENSYEVHKKIMCLK